MYRSVIFLKEMRKMNKLTTYNIEEKTFCDIHNCKMMQVPCSMYVYCPACEDAKNNTSKQT